MKKIILPLILVSITARSFAQKVSLALNLKQDSTYYLNTNANLTIDENIKGTSHIITTLVSAKVSHKVIRIRDTVYEMEVRYQRLGLQMEMGGKRIGFNSDDGGTTNISSQLMKAMANKPFTMLISKAGKVIQVNGLDKLFDDVFNDLPQVTEAQKAQFKTQMKSTFGENTIRNNFQESFAVFPNAPVGINDKWTNTVVNNAGMSALIKTTYCLKGVTDRNYLISGDAVIIPTGDGAFRQINRTTLRFLNVTGTSTSEIKLDKASGWISEEKMSRQIKGNVEIKDGPTMPGGMISLMSVFADLTVSNK